jgi:uncharacterized protein YjbI with pentapeptide repeats
VDALFALWIQTRRQRTEELRQALEEQRFETERAARQEQLVTDLYVKAIAYLGDSNAAVQIGGVYALARIGDTAPAEQQRITNALCAYLRTGQAANRSDGENGRDSRDVGGPESVERNDPSASHDARVRVEEAILEVLHDRLWLEAPHRWVDIDLDLSGAQLDEMSLVNVGLRSVRFDRCTFRKAVRLINCDITGTLALHDATIEGPLVIGGSKFHEDVWLDSSDLRGHVHMEAAEFMAGVSVKDCSMGGPVSLDAARSGGGAWFRGCIFGMKSAPTRRCSPMTSHSSRI